MGTTASMLYTHGHCYHETTAAGQRRCCHCGALEIGSFVVPTTVEWS
jgi:hypothetical protein